MGFYENAFRLLRECYRELGRDPATCRLADWRDAFSPTSLVGLADRSRDGSWHTWMACFPPGKGLPGDPLTEQNPFSVTGYLVRAAVLLRVLLSSCERREGNGTASFPGEAPSLEALGEAVSRILKLGMLGTMAALIEAVAVLEVLLGALPRFSDGT